MYNPNRTPAMKLKNYLYHLSGSDGRILAHCSLRLQRCFLLLGMMVAFFCLIAGMSSYAAFCGIFGDRKLNLLLALFFAWMLSNMYRLLLYAAAKDPLPQSKDNGSVWPTWVLRVLFVSFMALLISKPLECLLYKPALDIDLVAYKSRVSLTNRQQIQRYYYAQIEEVKRIIKDPEYSRRFIQNKELACKRAMEQAEALLSGTGFYIQRLRFLVSRHSSCWYITSSLFVLFLCPLILRRWLRDCGYETHRESAERRMVALNYYAFRKKYLRLFLSDHKRHVACNDEFVDPPYNTAKKEELRHFYTEQEFIAEFYHA